MSKRKTLSDKSLKIAALLSDFRNELLPQERTMLAQEIARNLIGEIPSLVEHEIAMAAIIRETLCGLYQKPKKRSEGPLAKASNVDYVAIEGKARKSELRFLVETKLRKSPDEDSEGSWHFDSLQERSEPAHQRSHILAGSFISSRVSTWLRIGDYSVFPHKES